MKIIKSFLMTFSMYTIIKTPRLDIQMKDIPYVFCFLPLVGIIISASSWGLFLLLGNFNAIFAGTLMTFLPVIITGGIHFDGFADTCDAYFSFANKERRLEIMSDPHMGAFGVIGLIMLFLTFVAAYIQFIDAPKYGYAVLISFIVSRCLLSIFSVNMTLAKKEGLLFTFVNIASKKAVTAVSVLLLMMISAIFIYIDLRAFIIYFAILAAFCCWYYRMVCKEFGGITGDLAGFLLVAIELQSVLIAAVFGVLL